MKTDSQLQQDVQDELRWEPSVDAAHIGVTAKNGVVTLTGHVPYYSQKWAAETATERVSGVKGIAEEIQTNLSDFNKHTDPDIAEAAITAMRWNSLVPDEKIQVKVENGTVTLLGDVDWNYQREAAKRDATTAAWGAPGVSLVTNQLQIV